VPWVRGLAVFDVDGVLADVAHRRHHLARPDWDAFFAAAADDPPLGTGVTMSHQCADAGLTVVYLSGRPERLRGVTSDWLDRHGLPAGELLLRPDHDRSPATRLKLRALRTLARRDDVVTFVDDDPDVVEAVRDARLVSGQVFFADWQTGARGDRDGPDLLHRAQQVEGRT
jgi:hypothetical protein